jgi:hypothetical protein
MTQPLIRDRQYGLPQVQKRLQEAYEGKTADLAKDIFSHATIELPTGFSHTIRKGDWAAVISKNSEYPDLYRVALWSLLSRRKVWNIDVDSSSVNPFKCALSSSGIVHLAPPSKTSKPHQLVCNGLITELWSLKWESLHLNAARVFGSWSQKYPTGFDGLVTFFGELDCSEGLYKWAKNILNLRELNQGEVVPVYAYNDEFWVRLSVTDLPRIEVINLTNRSSYISELPDELTYFNSACIVQNRLIYGKNYPRVFEPTKPSINIFDLVKRAVIAEYPTNGEITIPKNITANEHFVAWSEDIEDGKKEVKYLNLSTQKIRVTTTFNHPPRNITVDLHLSGSLLIVSYCQREDLFEHWWHREVIDLETGITVQNVKYTGLNGGTCSYNNGILLIAESPNLVNSKMYIESFIQDFNTQEKSEFRA